MIAMKFAKVIQKFIICLHTENGYAWFKTKGEIDLFSNFLNYRN